MKKFILLLLVFCAKQTFAQEIVVDPATSAAIAVNTGMMNSQLNATNNKLDLIQKGQLAVSGQLTVINSLQSRIYNGLSQVASVLNNLNTIKEIAECGSDIITDVESSVRIARSNPVLLLFV